MFSHEEDLAFWQHVIEAILKVDCVLTYMDDPLNKKGSIQAVKTSGLQGLMTLDTSNLVDFNQI